MAGTGTAGTGTTQARQFLYYYHPDHLGSTGYVTDANGKIYEHLEYFPFGETWVQEHSNTLRTPYLFTGKEFDQETGLYYFGARYYDPRTSVWESADPILGKYLPSGDDGKDEKLPGMGGVFNSINLALYTYAGLNPLKLIDPDGRAPQKPYYQDVAAAYADINKEWMRGWFNFTGNSQHVADKIGGNMKANHDAWLKNGDVNTCTMRLSYALDHGGGEIGPDSLVAESGSRPGLSGADGKGKYLYGVRDMIAYLNKKYGGPTDVGLNPMNGKGGDNKGGIQGMFQRIHGQKGVLIYLDLGKQMSGATGHATLFNGENPVQEGHHYEDYKGMKAYFYKLPDKPE